MSLARGLRGDGKDGKLRLKRSRVARLLSLTPTFISLAASNPSPYVGQSETLTATVTALTGVPTPGSVTFLDGSTLLGTVALNNNGPGDLHYVELRPWVARHHGRIQRLCSTRRKPGRR